MRYLLLALFGGGAFSQGVITTAVGTDPTFQDNGQPALQARIGASEGITVGPDGTVYFSDYDNVQIYRVGADGIIRVVAGNGLHGFSGDGGPATGSILNLPLRLAFDNKGNLYFADCNNGRIRKITPDGIISTVAGNGSFTTGGDEGPAVKAALTAPRGVALDSAGNIYIAETNSNRIRKVTADGIIHTIAGTGEKASSGDGGPALNAAINTPRAVAVDAAGNVFVAETPSGKVRKINAADGTISTFVTISNPLSVQIAANGLLYITSFNKIVSVTPDGKVQTVVAGTGTADFSGDGGKAVDAALNTSLDAAIGSDGKLYISDAGNFRIRVVDTAGNISTFAGNGLYRVSPEGAPASTVELFRPFGLTFDGPGNLYIAEFSINRVRRVARDGSVFTVAGTGRTGPVTNGIPAIQATLNGPTALAVDPSGNLYVADAINAQIRKIDGQGIITRFAGGGSSQAEGVASTSAQLS